MSVANIGRLQEPFRRRKMVSARFRRHSRGLRNNFATPSYLHRAAKLASTLRFPASFSRHKSGIVRRRNITLFKKAAKSLRNKRVKNLIREFEMSIMKESQTIKYYAKQLLSIANKELDKTTISKVRIGNGEYISVRGKGTVAIESLSSLKLILDVLFVPNIDQNLLSVGQLLEKGFKVLFEDKFCMIKDANGKNVFKIKMRGKSFALNLLEEEQAIRLGHFHHNGVLYMNKNQLAVGLPDLKQNLPTCIACQYGKQSKLPFPQKSTWRSSHKLQLVHTDVGGPQRTPSLKGSETRQVDKKAEVGIFVAYNNQSKTYRVYMPHADKVIVSRDVKFTEDDKWSWDAKKNQNFEFLDENIDDIPIRDTKSLSDIYQRCNVAVFEPAGFNEAIEDKNRGLQCKRSSAIGVKWVYRTKLNSNGSVNKHKARLVVKGYAQMFGMNFSETFALVARLDTIRMLLALPTQKGWKIYRLDVKSAFLNGYLEEEIFVEQPEEFAVKGKEDKVYQLRKALYGLKQAPRAWYNRINAHLLGLGFKKSQSESTLYIRKINAGRLIISLYIDDLLVTGSNQYLMDKFKDEMEEVFEMTDLGDMSYFLGMEVHHNQHEIFICQQQYAKEILKKFKMEECKPTATDSCPIGVSADSCPAGAP
uniref:Uncharacterized protein n=1 Tax=Vitis vinifera TaxID=29760 RepID=A5AJD6_VITVI|nr:hypothetical protein VITISV_029281 [Vitis vinifera]